ncbi:MAG TPA: hypothetical protein VD929_00495 [Caulobacteraceae bacterium]|nr:hypothetical protein [Caulobacteraceae bacterium]
MRAVDPPSRHPVDAVGATGAVTVEQDPSAADYRLVIEEDPEAGTFVYKTLDRRTGEVVRQAPREEVLRLREDPAYAAGGVITTTA